MFVSDNLEAAGVSVRYCPVDAHYQMGLIERHNAVWRWTWNRTCDASSVIGDGAVDDCILAVNDAKNNSVRRAGRTANQCVFGRTPRILGELLADDVALHVAVNTPENSRLAAKEYYGAEANMHIAQFNYNQEVKKSILRKVCHAHADCDRLVAGHKVGVWRTVGRARAGGRSRLPGYLVGTFTGWGAGRDGKPTNAWVRLGVSLKLVAREQLRPAVGFEQWVPDADDLKMLKETYDLRRDGLWEDEREAGPDPDAEADADVVVASDVAGESPLPSRPSPSFASAELPAKRRRSVVLEEQEESPPADGPCTLR